MALRVFKFVVLALSVGVLGLGSTSCGKDDTTGPVAPQKTGIKGSIACAPGASCDANNARVAVYKNLQDFYNDSFLKQTGAVAAGTNVWSYELELNVGEYFLDIWKDLNGDGVPSSGDIYAYYTTGTSGSPSPIPVEAGKMFEIPTLQLGAQLLASKVRGRE